MPVPTNRSRWLLTATVAILGGGAAWLLLPADDDQTPTRKQFEADEPTQLTPKPTGVTSEHTLTQQAVAVTPPHMTRPSPAAVSKAATQAAAGKDTFQVVGAGPNDPHEPGMVPHPLDEEHGRIDTENRLLQALNDAMASRNASAMRQLLAQYRELDPEDVDAYQYGYDVIADCIEFPGAASRAAGQKFYNTQRHSSLRRFVRRICFESESK